MNTIDVNLGDRSYPILIGDGLLPELGKHLDLPGLSNRVLLVSNPTVYSLYGATVTSSLTKAGFEVVPALIPDSETAKSLSVAQELYDQAVEHSLERMSPVIALGGGVVGDLAGFVAATYMRGVPFIQLPTTLLAQVDSSVGGKVAVNHPKGKNLIGCFYQPRLVISDLSVLRTLPPRELKAGVAEVIKYGVIWDYSFFSFLEENLQAVMELEPAAIGTVVHRSCAIKASIVETDETERGIRSFLNFGHTIGHALETLTDYKTYLHGEAVAIGMKTVADLAARKNWLPAAEKGRITALIQAAGLPDQIPPEITREALIASFLHDKKAVRGKVTLIVPETIGRVHSRALTLADIEGAL